MTKGILGRKIGMTQLFLDNGELIPVTVVQAEPNVVLQKKTMENDGYEAIQIGFHDERDSRINKAGKGHAEKANTSPKRRSEEHTSELQSRGHLVCRLLLEKKKQYSSYA